MCAINTCTSCIGNAIAIMWATIKYNQHIIEKITRTIIIIFVVLILPSILVILNVLYLLSKAPETKAEFVQTNDTYCAEFGLESPWMWTISIFGFLFIMGECLALWIYQQEIKDQAEGLKSWTGKVMKDFWSANLKRCRSLGKTGRVKVENENVLVKKRTRRREKIHFFLGHRRLQVLV